MENVHRIFKCWLCEFTSESERGRQIHLTKTHSKADIDKLLSNGEGSR